MTQSRENVTDKYAYQSFRAKQNNGDKQKRTTYPKLDTRIDIPGSTWPGPTEVYFHLAMPGRQVQLSLTMKLLAHISVSDLRVLHRKHLCQPSKTVHGFV